jgi:hypothetical protein
VRPRLNPIPTCYLALYLLRDARHLYLHLTNVI